MAEDIEKNRLDDVMASIASAIGVRNAVELTPIQRQTFEFAASWIIEYGLDLESATISLQRHAGNYWRSGMIMILQTGSYRPSVIKKIFAAYNPERPISFRILSMNLQSLERDGIISRTEVELGHVEYSLTPFGMELAEQVRPFTIWVAQNADRLLSARLAYDAIHSHD